ncbi:hypothetical protein CDD83_5187 [Cordyceps sp. RAO-2017]|nr:hypothetical protein CDD83_5187 [Cordyceps sp. RAO-2017]
MPSRATDPAAPLVASMEPRQLQGFRPGAPHDAQPPSIPALFIDAMKVREQVFVEEQKVPAENEFDADDSRSCHWVAYLGADHADDLAVRDASRRDRPTPVGTIRMVPFPHDPHPKAGGKYWSGVLEGDERKPAIVGVPEQSTVPDRPTSFHDGKEPYIKLGRLAVVSESRGKRVAGLLVEAALSWLKANPAYFDLSLAEQAAQRRESKAPSDDTKWRGLVCVHAQEQVMDVWAKWGFRLDEVMGKWCEEGIPHVGMFQRLDIHPKDGPN